jgi:hypothetical protein
MDGIDTSVRLGRSSNKPVIRAKGTVLLRSIAVATLNAGEANEFIYW